MGYIIDRQELVELTNMCMVIEDISLNVKYKVLIFLK